MSVGFKIQCIHTGERSAQNVGVFTVNDESFAGPGRVESDVPQVVIAAQFDDELRGIKLTPRAAAQLGARLIDLGLGMMQASPPRQPENPPGGIRQKRGTRGKRRATEAGTVGYILRRRRESLHISAQKLANLMDLSITRIYAWERNRGTPPENRRRALAKLLGMPAGWLKQEIEKARVASRSEGKNEERPGASAA